MNEEDRIHFVNTWQEIWGEGTTNSAEDAFKNALAFTLMWEGGYVNHPKDPGGETRYGITYRVARAKGYRGSMRELPLDFAKDFYKKSIWDRYKFGDINNPGVAGYLFDMAVNHGQWTRIAQRAVNHTYGTHTIEDGVWGNNTHTAFRRTVEGGYSNHFLDALKVERCRYVKDLVVKNRSRYEGFLFGWLRRYLA